MAANNSGNPFATNNSGGGVGLQTAMPDMNSSATLQPGQNTPYTTPNWLTGDMANSMQPIQNYPITNYGRWNWGANGLGNTNGYGMATNGGWPPLQFPGAGSGAPPPAGAGAPPNPPGSPPPGPLPPVGDPFPPGQGSPPPPPSGSPPSQWSGDPSKWGTPPPGWTPAPMTGGAGFGGHQTPTLDANGMTPQGLTGAQWSSQQAANRANLGPGNQWKDAQLQAMQTPQALQRAFSQFQNTPANQQAHWLESNPRLQGPLMRGGFLDQNTINSLLGGYGPGGYGANPL